MPLPIYVIGSSNTDIVVKVDRLPGPGETVIGGQFLMNPGGKGANQAVAAARLGGDVTFVARVGSDVFGKQALDQFQKENIRTEFIFTDNVYPSGVALIGVDAKGENNIIVAPGSNAELSIVNVETALSVAKAHGIVLIQLEIPIPTVEFAISQSYKQGLKVILNPAPARELHPSFLKYLFCITPNEHEVELLTGISLTDKDSIVAAAIKLHEFGVQNVIITLGKNGAFLSNASGQKFVPTAQVKAIDTTAAGDCFNGALAMALAEGNAVEYAVAFACAAASIAVTRLGAQASMPFRNEVEQVILT